MIHHTRMIQAVAATLFAAVCLVHPDQGLAQGDTSSTTIELQPIEVIGVTPAHGSGLPISKVPANVQTADDTQIAASDSLDLTQFMNRNLAGVHTREAGGNPFQPDVLYRGFAASPLLGLPQGLAVYQDGVRLNEPFGDVVSWDLIPQPAIASLELMPGSNPLFGLNTLGGAISIQTKTGFTSPGQRAQIYGGSFGRKALELESGGHTAQAGYFVTANLFDEEGWRDFSGSQVKQLFGDVGWQGEAATLDLSLTGADTELRGNGPLPVQLLALDRKTAFTHPDITENRMVMASLRGTYAPSSTLLLSSTAYFRHNNNDTFNGDDTNLEACSAPAETGLLCSTDESTGAQQVVIDQNGNPVAATPAVDSATNNTTATQQRAYGLSLQGTLSKDLKGRQNQLIVGATIDDGRAHFTSATELAQLTPDRGTQGSGIFDAAAFVDLDARVRSVGLYLTDTLSVTERLAVTLGGRYNDTTIELRDRLGTALSGDHSFSRFNPAAGATYQVRDWLSVYAGYSESSRAPTPVELTCADRDAPCRLPNAFLSDPPLEQPVARTWESGVRGNLGRTRWSLGAFRTTVSNDIQFISAGPFTNSGFFDNVGKTRRQGLELNLQGRTGTVDWLASYSFVDATFESPLTLSSPNNPAAVDGEIQVQPGDRLPGIPRHIFKAGADWALTKRLTLGGDLLYNSSQFLRGDESNQLTPIAGYTLVSLRGEYRLTKVLSAFAKIDNVLDEEYETAGVLGDARGVLGDQFDDPRFLTPGAPRGAWVGVKVALP